MLSSSVSVSLKTVDRGLFLLSVTWFFALIEGRECRLVGGAGACRGEEKLAGMSKGLGTKVSIGGKGCDPRRRRGFGISRRWFCMTESIERSLSLR